MQRWTFIPGQRFYPLVSSWRMQHTGCIMWVHFSLTRWRYTSRALKSTLAPVEKLRVCVLVQRTSATCLQVCQLCWKLLNSWQWLHKRTIEILYGKGFTPLQSHAVFICESVWLFKLRQASTPISSFVSVSVIHRGEDWMYCIKTLFQVNCPYQRLCKIKTYHWKEMQLLLHIEIPKFGTNIILICY